MLLQKFLTVVQLNQVPTLVAFVQMLPNQKLQCFVLKLVWKNSVTYFISCLSSEIICISVLYRITYILYMGNMEVVTKKDSIVIIWCCLSSFLTASSLQENILPNLQALQDHYLSKDRCCNYTAAKIDKVARVLFPTVFLIFNIVYWTYYLVVADDKSQGHQMHRF